MPLDPLDASSLSGNGDKKCNLKHTFDIQIVVFNEFPELKGRSIMDRTTDIQSILELNLLTEVPEAP